MKHIYQHDWDDVDHPHIPRWPSKTGEKRPLEVHISSWKGYSAGARHLYAEVTEAKNEYWSEKNNAWVDVSCDSESAGYHLKADIYTLKEAVKIVTAFVEMVAGKKRSNHEIAWEGPGCPKWATKGPWTA
jgi:hypothetical protein